MKTSLISLNSLFKSLLFFMLMVSVFSCKKDSAETNGNFLKGYWIYLNGAQVYYDGTSDSAIGTKVPDNNVGFDFVVGENYWQDLKKTSDTTWVLDHIVRLNNGTKTYNPTTFKKMNNNIIVANISGYGRDTLTKKP